MRVLITGASGFTASHLIRLLEVDSGVEVFCTDISVAGNDHWLSCDLTDAAGTLALLRATKPDQAYHLAGNFSNDYDSDYKVNVLSTKNIFDACLSLGHQCRILLIGSSAEYGMVSHDENPVREDHPLSPVSIYGLTKAYQTMLMHYYRNLHKLDVVMARTFNLLGRGLSPKLFVGRLYEQIAAYKKGKISRIQVGNLENKRDYMHIEDAVRCYRLIVERGIAGEIYNVGSGRSIRMYDLLCDILTENGLSTDAIQQTAVTKSHTIDIPDIYAELTKLNRLVDIS
jgi:GDP-4-dehydro-6-deoxy-D-mannose reductase